MRTSPRRLLLMVGYVALLGLAILWGTGSPPLYASSPAQDAPTPTMDHSAHQGGQSAAATATPLPASTSPITPTTGADHAAHHPAGTSAITGTAPLTQSATGGMMGSMMAGGMMGSMMDMAAMHEGMAAMMAEMQGMMDSMMAEQPEMMSPAMAARMGRMMGMMEGMSGMMEGMSGMMGGGMMESMSKMMEGGMMEGGMMASMHGHMQGMMKKMEGMMGEMMSEMPAAMQERMESMRSKMADMMGMMEGMGAHDGAAAAGEEGAATDHSAHEGTPESAAPDATDPHAGHGAAASTESADPSAHAEAAPEAISEVADPHAGHGAAASSQGADHSAHAAHGPVSSIGVPAATATSGAQPLEPRIEEGVKVFELTAQPVIWPITEGVTVTAWTYNGTVPGPMLRVTEGDRVRIVVKNELPDATAIHWHGLLVPNVMDGAAPMTQAAIEPGATFTYEFEAKPAGSFMYHSHVQTDKQVLLGLYAPFIIDPKEPEADAPDVDVVMMLSEWRVVNGETSPAMPMAGMEPNYFTINGKAFPATEPLNVKVGDKVRIRFMGIGQFVHPMHLHGTPFKVVATDGYAVPEAAQLTKDTILVSPGERYDIEFTATEPGQWMLHCHIPHHITNDGAEPGGLVVMVNVTE